ncbi:MAG: class I SAM-dependent methyltransferase [Alphaproteobacteria bacterium]
MNRALGTLFHPFATGLIRPAPGSRAVFMNAGAHPGLVHFHKDALTLQQYFKPATVLLERAGFTVSSDLPEACGSYNIGLLLFPKNIVEGTSMLARMAGALREGSVLVCAADNKAGGTRLKKLLQQFGFINIQEVSKNKARVVWGTMSGILPEILRAALDKGSLHVSSHGFASQAGLFGWDKIDRGSEILTRHLPADLKGAGADFGCGYGYLAHHVLRTCPDVSLITCMDADARAIQAARDNLKKFGSRAGYIWDDLTQNERIPGSLAWIVMNPPFHEAERNSIATGQNFVKTAHACLRTGGALWMVANAHLPYERELREHFKACEKIFEGGGFKIYRAQK